MVGLRKTRQRRFDYHIDEFLRKDDAQYILRGVAVFDGVVHHHEAVSVYRPRDVAGRLLLTVGILRAELLEFQVHLQVVRGGMERRLAVDQNDDILALNHFFLCHIKLS